MFDVIFGLYNPFPLDPRRPLHILYIMFIETYHCSKGILGLRGKHLKKQTERPRFHFPMANITILRIIRTHVQKEYRKV